MRFSSDRSGRRNWPWSPASIFWPTRRRRRRLRRSDEGQGRNPPSHRGAEISRSWPGGVPSVGSSCPQPSYSRPHQGGRAIASGDAVAFLSSVIPAQAGIQRPKTRHSPLDSRLRGNDGNREVGEPKCDCPASRGGGNWIRRALRYYRERYSSTNSRYLCVSVVQALLGHQLVFHQVFGDLNGVEGRTLAKIIGDDPHRKSVLNGRILPQAADEDRILAGAFDGGHVALVGAMVDDGNARRGAQR